MDSRTHMKTPAGRKTEGPHRASGGRADTARADAGRALIDNAPDDELAVGMLIGRARSILLTNLDSELEQYGLSGVQYAVLKYLADGTALTAVDLSRLLHYDTGSMTRMLDRLEEKALLRRERGKEDRRVVYLRITPAARTLLPKLRTAGARVLDRGLAGFSSNEIDALKGYLNRMIDNGHRAHED
jgi:MarR family transcriptional regulator, multiple antibiotic resistance protein MarR